MKNIVNEIIRKYLSTRHPAATEKMVQQWIIKDKGSKEKEQASLEFWDELNCETDSKTYEALDRVNSRIGFSQKPKKAIPLYRKLGRVAAILLPLLIIAGGYAYYKFDQINMIEIYVAYGEEKHLFLPDSSEIWINAGTTVKYPKEFGKDKRTVQLDGEAYFSVRKDASKPFIVNAKNMSVKVLGTKFNVKAYSNDEHITTTLTSGKVEVITKDQSKILNPSEQLSFNRKTTQMDVNQIPNKETSAWLNGQLIFTENSLSEIFKTLERKFNVTIKAELPQSEKLYTIKFLKEDSLHDILSVLQDLADFKFEIKNNTVYVTE